MALTLLTTVLSVAVPLVVRHGRLLADCRSYRLALDELSNELDRLSSLPPGELADSLERLELSALTARSLPGARLTGQLDPADIGVRLTLRLSWGDPQYKPPAPSDRAKVAGTTHSVWHAAPRREAHRGATCITAPSAQMVSARRSRVAPPARHATLPSASRRGATCHTARSLTLVAWVLPKPPATISPTRPEESP